MRFWEPLAQRERKVKEGAAFLVGYLYGLAWRGRRLAAVEALEVQMIVQGNQLRDEHGSWRVLLVTDQRNHVFLRTEKG